MRSLLLILVFSMSEAPKATSSQKPVEWPAGNAVISRSEMCKPENRAMLGPLKIAGIHWGGALYADDEMARKRPGLVKQVNMVHAAGARYIGSVNGRGLLLRGMDDEAVRLLDGTPMRHGPMNNAIFKCSLNSKVQTALLLAARQSIDIGMDGLILDSWQAEGRTLCFCTHCIGFYQECLRKYRDDPRLADLADMDPSAFDYGEYLRSRGFDAKTPLHKLPFGQPFQDYRFSALLDSKRDLLGEIRQYGRQKSRGGFHLTANVYSMQPITFAIEDLLDYFSVELPYFGSFDGYPPHCSSIALLKKAHPVGKRCVIQPGCHDTARALISQSATSTLFKIWIAEAYASGHLFDLIPKEFAGHENGQVVWLHLPVKDLLPYYGFVQSHPEIYTGTTSPARVAVVYSLTAAKVETPEFEREYQAVCKVLHDAHYQFDVVLSGDGQWRKPPVTRTDPERYEAVVVIRPQLIDEETEASLLAHHSKGHKLLLCGPSRSQRHGSETFRTTILGRDVAPPDMQSFTGYLKSRDPAVRGRLSKELGPDPLLSTNAPPSLGILCWKTKNRTIVHLLNYAYDQAADKTTSAENIRLRLRTDARKATLITPDAPETRILTVEREGPFVSLLVPQVLIYSTVMIE